MDPHKPNPTDALVERLREFDAAAEAVLASTAGPLTPMSEGDTRILVPPSPDALRNLRHAQLRARAALSAMPEPAEPVSGVRKMVNLVLEDDHKRQCEGRFYSCSCGYDEQVQLAAIAVSDALPPPPAEPVAWMYEQDGCIVEFRQHRLTNVYDREWTETPLYKAPPPPEPAGWRSMDTCPNSGQVVMFHVPGERFHMNRADDFHNSGIWLEKATHWMPLPPPPGAEPAGEPTP